MFQVSTPWSERLYGLLADQQWHDREPVLQVVAKAVPPGLAKREMLAAQQRELSRRTTARARPDRVVRSDQALIHAGQRRVALLSSNRNPRIATRGAGQGAQIRLRPHMDRARAVNGRCHPADPRTASDPRSPQGDASRRPRSWPR